MNGGMVPPKTTHAAPTKLGFVPADNRVYIDANWTAKDGVPLIDNLFLGKVLGAGMQMSVAVLPESFGCHCIPVDALWAVSRHTHPDADMEACPLLHGQIFELRDGSGRIAPIVLKVLKSGALIGDIEREWEAGQKVSQLADQDGNLPGFMKVGPALVRPDGKMLGQVLERLNGKSVSKAFSDKKFADIHYIRGMMLEVFTALDKAQRAFGFHHCDFRLENVMEHFPSREHNADDAVSIAVAGRPENRLYARQFKMIDYGLAKFDDLYCAAHGWLEQEAQGEAADGKMNDSVKLAFPEWIHHTAWKGKGDVYHLVFDVTQFIYGRVWPEEDKGEVELLLMLISHICGVRPKAWFRPDQKLSGSNASNVSNLVESRTASTKYAIPEKATTNVGKALQAYGKYSRVQRWGRKLKGWRWPHNPGITAAEILTSAFFYNPPGRGIDRPSSKVLSEDEVRLHK